MIQSIQSKEQEAQGLLSMFGNFSHDFRRCLYLVAIAGSFGLCNFLRLTIMVFRRKVEAGKSRGGCGAWLVKTELN